MSTKRVRKLAKYMKGPIKILARARDFYVQSMTSCAGHISFGNGNGMGCPAPQLVGLPRSFSASSTYSNSSSREEDFRELVRIASTRSLPGKVEPVILLPKNSSPPGGGRAAAFPRSRTVTIGRIEEDKQYEFGVDEGGARAEVYPRSRSYAASKRIGML